MPGLIQHTSNQLDLLARQLSAVTSLPLASPFTPEIVVVQSLATRRWVTFQIAQDQKICANYIFPFLSDFTVWLVKLGFPENTLVEKTSPELLAWRIDSLLRRSLERKEFAPLASYLRDGDSLKRFHLAIRLANLFDQYRVYRPEMISEWETSKKKRTGDEAWQAMLWRQLEEPSAFDQALQQLRVSGFKNADRLNLPGRVSIFAPGSLPPACFDLLFQLSRIRDVHLFLLRPSAEYRGSDITPKQRARRALPDSESTTGNLLATSWGRMDVELTDLLLEKEERFGIPISYAAEQFAGFKEDTLLGTIQSDILAARNRGAAPGTGDEDIPRATVQLDDRSLTLHACYSPMREVEVLYDQLLDCFERMPGLRPRDILVMTPAIETYAPFIQAVFRYPEDKSMRIPYSLADRHPRSESEAVETFLSLLQLPGSRYTASQIFGLLGSRSIRRRFRFDDEELSMIRDWIDRTNIRWGIDSEHRKRLGLPDLNTNTWRHGLQRLLLGYAMEGNSRLLFEGILPYDEVEGDGGDLLGRFATAAEALFRLTEELDHARPLAEWANPLTSMIDQFFDPIGEDDVRDVRFLRMIVDQLRTLSGKDANDDVDYPVVREYLEGRVATKEQRGNFFSTGITFCALKPARGIPARVICLLGINDQIFPRRAEPSQFDLMAHASKLGDPSPRQDDRYSFLQAILAAKEKLIISYVGRSAIHNQHIPPSVVVSELLDYASQACVFPGDKSAKEFLFTEHPLQAFSPRYFAEARESDRLFGYSEANAAASRTICLAPVVEAHPFISGPLPQRGEPARNLELRELIDFWRNPAKYFVRQRLGLNLRDRGFCLDDNEPFVPTALEIYPVKQELLTQELDGEDLPFEIFEARGVLPSGFVGRLQLESIRAEMEKLAGKVGEKIGDGKKDPPVSIDLILPGYTLTGTLENMYGGQAVHFRPANLQPKDHLRAWIEHLALSLQNPSDKAETMLVGRDGAVTFDPVSSATTELRTLCDLYLTGLSQPLRFFPQASMAFADAILRRQKDPIKKAHAKWEGQYRRVGKREGEKDDPYFALCFENSDPFEDPFADIALKVFETLLNHSRPDDR